MSADDIIRIIQNIAGIIFFFVILYVLFFKSDN